MAVHEAITAIVDSSDVAKGDLRDLLVDRYAYIVTTANESQSLAADDSGTAIQCLIYNGFLFGRDDADVSTAHDGTTCLVSSDGVRFKKEDVPFPFSVLDILNTPPGSPSNGDAYIVDTSPTGDWASNAKYVAVYTARGWVFIAPAVGMTLLVEDVDVFYHYNTSASWAIGLDDGSGLTDNSVYPNSLLFPCGIPTVEDQTTTAPPGGASAGDAYIIGSSATGDWSGKDDYLAVYDGAAWQYHAPADGMMVYDLTLETYYKYEDSSWSLALPVGLVVAEKRADTAHGDGWNSVASTNPGAFNIDNPPDQTVGTIVWNFTHTLASSSNYLQFIITIQVENIKAILVYVDSETEPRIWTYDEFHGVGQTGTLHLTGSIEVGDTSSHNYKVRVVQASANTARYRGSSVTYLEVTS